jgi:hypothetical protein
MRASVNLAMTSHSEEQPSLFRNTYFPGKQCLPMLEHESIDRLRSRGLINPGQPFYCLRLGDYPTCTWSGKGQTPGWVKEWIDQGGSMADIEATL